MRFLKDRIYNAFSIQTDGLIRVGDFLFLMFIGCASIFVHPFIPQDDLNRHLVAYLYNYKWQNLYIYSRVPSYDPWIGFDIIAGLLHRLAGYTAFIIIQEISFILFSIAVFIHIRKTQNSLGLFMYALYAYFCYGRLLLGRPAEIVASVSFISLGLPFPFNIILSTLMVPVYWLFWVYILPLCLWDRRHFITIIAGFIFWCLYSGGEYFKTVSDIIMVTDERIFKVSENISILYVILPAMVCFWPVLYRAAFMYQIKDTLMLLYYLLLNQAKLFTALIMSSGRFLERARVKIPDFMVIIAITLIAVHPSGKAEFNSEDLTLLKNSRVLVLNFDSSVFQLTGMVYPLKIAPSMEIGWTERDIQTLIKKAHTEGKFDCKMFKKYSFDYVIENSLTEYPECLELVKLAGKYRIWKSLDPG